MKLDTCRRCGQLDEETGVCRRYGRDSKRVFACGLANKKFNVKPFSRRGAENARKWFAENHKENKENE